MILQTTSFIGASLAASAVTSKHGCLHCAVDRTPEYIMGGMLATLIVLAMAMVIVVVLDMRRLK